MAQPCEVERIEEGSLKAEAYVLRDAATGAEARVAPSFGHNLYSFRVPIRGRPLEAMLGPDPDASPGFRFGNPILFPYPNRVRAGRFGFRGKQYQLDVNVSGNAIHGLVAALPWRVEAAAPTADGARVSACVVGEEHPDVFRQFPFPFRITLAYTLKGDTVRLDAEAGNMGREPMPMGFGIHPWFALPLNPAGRRQDCLVRVPAGRQWELGATLVPTGRVMPVPPARDFRKLRCLGDHELDDVYTGVELADGASECVLRDPSAGAEVVVRADARFREWVVYAPRGRSTICFEPYTCPTDALNLQPRGIDAGLIVLEPGETWRGAIWFTVRPV